jgi:hypothetical protein
MDANYGATPNTSTLGIAPNNLIIAMCTELHLHCL